MGEALPSTTSAESCLPLFSRFASVGSEEAPIEGLASVRHSNGTCSFPAFRFHEWFREVRREGSVRQGLPCPPESGPSASDLRTSNDRIVSSKRDVRVFHKGTFHLHAPFSSTSIAQSSIHSRTSFPGPLSIRRRRSRELFVSRFRYYYVLRLLPVHHFPFRFRL